MAPVGEYIRGAEGLWFGWLVAGLAALVVTARGLARLTRADLRRVLSEEDGAAYSMAYVMTVPIYVLLVCFVVELTFVLVAKMGTVYAAYAAARSNIVYRSLDSGGADDRARQAAIRAMLPFASSSRMHGGSGGGNGAGEYDTAYRRYAPGGFAPSEMIRMKFGYATKATTIQVSKQDSAPNGLVRATVRYAAPLHVSMVGKVIGRKAGKYYVVDLTTSVALPDEEPVSEDRTLGIRYDPPR